MVTRAETDELVLQNRVNRSIYKVPGMDCAAEEAMIRMALDGRSGVRSLRFDLAGRKLEVFHGEGLAEITEAIDRLGLGGRLISTEEAGREPDEDHAGERRVLWQVLGINFGFFVLEMATGIIASSMGLIADSLDMLADAFVYGLALVAVGGTVARKKVVARTMGYLQLVLAIIGLAEVARRGMGYGEVPEFTLMVVVSALALAGNAISLILLNRNRSRGEHMRASVICTSNDVIMNAGVIAAGVLVFATASRLPDLLIGTVVFILVGRGAFRILKLAR